MSPVSWLSKRRDDDAPRAWLFTIMHNLFVSQRRRPAIRPDVEMLGEQAGILFGAPGGQADAMA